MLFGYALRDVLGIVLDGLRGREVMEDIAGSLRTWSAASSSSSMSDLRLRDIKGSKGRRDMDSVRNLKSNFGLN